MLPSAAAHWQTPATDNFRSRGGDREDEMGLDRQARTWPTPTAGDSNASGSAAYSTESGRHSGTTLTDAAVRGLQAQAIAPAGSNTSGKAVLNPQFVEVLMGWPIGASGLQPLATDGFRRWLRLHGGPSGAESMSEAVVWAAVWGQG
jgi:hypothetical protein